jgi:hypothetical protein
MKIWLDDVRVAPPGWTWVKTPEEAIALLETGLVLEISLDHDLGLDEQRTGYTVAAWMENAVATGSFEPPTSIVVHSANPVGRARMDMAIASIVRLRAARSPEFLNMPRNR